MPWLRGWMFCNGLFMSRFMTNEGVSAFGFAWVALETGDLFTSKAFQDVTARV